MELWRNWLTETERQWNSFFAEVMGRDSFGRVAGSYMEAYSVVQRALNQGMERYLNTDRKSTRLNSSHQIISYAVFCLKKKKSKNKNEILLLSDGLDESRGFDVTLAG